MMSGRFQRLTPVLLTAAIGLLVVSVILQGIMCVAILSFPKPMKVLITNREVPVNVENSEVDVHVANVEVPVRVENDEVDVNVENHHIVEGDPIPVTIVR